MAVSGSSTDVGKKQHSLRANIARRQASGYDDALERSNDIDNHGNSGWVSPQTSGGKDAASTSTFAWNS